MFFEVIKADYVSEHKISLVFKDGKKGMVDLSEYLGNNDVFKSFSDMSFFRNFSVQYGTLVWGNGEVDIAPETLYNKTLAL